MARVYPGSFLLLRLSLAIFFVILGLIGVLPDVNEFIFVLNSGIPTLDMVFAIVELVCGALLLLGLIEVVNKNLVRYAGFVVFFFWIARIVVTKIIWGLNFGYPLILNGILILAAELVVLAAISIIIRKYD